MLKKILIIFLIFYTFQIFANENIFNFDNSKKQSVILYKSKYFIFNNNLFNYYGESKKEKIKIFDKPDFSWFKEKYRLEKLFIAIGAISLTIGFSMLLAGIINCLVPFNAVSIDGEPINTNQYVYFSLMGVGGGLMGVGIPFLIVGSVRLGLKIRKNKLESKDKNENNKSNDASTNKNEK